MTRVALAVVLVAAGVGAAGGCGSSGSGGSGSAASGGGSSGGGWAHLTVVYRPHGRYPAPGQADVTYRWSLSCGPPGGTHPARAAACFELVRHPRDLIGGGPQCMLILRGGRSAVVTGEMMGDPVHFAASTCSPAWRTLPGLLTGFVSGGGAG